MSVDQRIVASTEQLETDVELNHQITHGDENTVVQTNGGPVPSIKKQIKDIETEWSKTADPLADDLAETVQVTKGYKDETAQSAEQVATDRQQVEQSTSTVSQLATQVTDDKIHIDQQVIAVDADTQQAQQAATDSQQAVSDSQSILNDIGSTLIGHVTNLVRTQTIVVQHHAFN